MCPGVCHILHEHVRFPFGGFESVTDMRVIEIDVESNDCFNVECFGVSGLGHEVSAACKC